MQSYVQTSAIKRGSSLGSFLASPSPTPLHQESLLLVSPITSPKAARYLIFYTVFNSERNLLNMNYSNRCSIITGPNSSGKTVYLKQVALSIYLAHLGFFVPAALAEIPLIDSIICVGKTDSIYRDQHCGFDYELASLSSITQPCND